MHLYKRGKIWWIEYVVDGVRHRQSTNATKKADAQVKKSLSRLAENASENRSAKFNSVKIGIRLQNSA
jgi:hypothetical protein